MRTEHCPGGNLQFASPVQLKGIVAPRNQFDTFDCGRMPDNLLSVFDTRAVNCNLADIEMKFTVQQHNLGNRAAESAYPAEKPR